MRKFLREIFKSEKQKMLEEDQQRKERAEKYHCDGRCYYESGICPAVDTCEETRVGEGIATMGAVLVIGFVSIMLLFFGVWFIIDFIKFIFFVITG